MRDRKLVRPNPTNLLPPGADAYAQFVSKASCVSSATATLSVLASFISSAVAVSSTTAVPNVIWGLTSSALSVSSTTAAFTNAFWKRADAALWLQSDTGVTQSSGSVSAWADMSASGYSATGSGATEPTYTASDSGYSNQPSIDFSSAAASVLSIAGFATLAQPYTLIFVGEGTSAGGTLMQFGNFTGLYFTNTPALGYYAGTAQASSTAPTTPEIVAGVFNGASSALYRNSSTTPISTANPNTHNTSGGLLIGAGGLGGNLQGKAVLVAVFSSALSTATLGEIFKYAATKYGTAWS